MAASSFDTMWAIVALARGMHSPDTRSYAGPLAGVLHAAINARKPENGFITGTWIASGWTAQPDYTKEH